MAVKKAGAAGLSVNATTLYLWGIPAVILLGYMASRGENIVPAAQKIPILAGVAVFSFLGGILMNKALYIAPNPGYVAAIVGASTLFIVFASWFFFASEITLIHLAGTLLIVGGVVLMGF